MKHIAMIVIVGLFLADDLQAQFLGGFFDQSATRLKYMAQQVAELQVYIGYAEKGYSLVENGLQTIKGITNGEFNLHSAFLGSLKKINPQVGKMTEVAEIISLQVSIVEQCSHSLKTYQQSPWLRGNEIGYIRDALSSVLQAGLSDVNTLVSLITTDEFQMTDDERIKRVDEIDEDMKQQSVFVQSFTEGADLLCQQRQHEQSGLSTMKALYGLP